MAKTTSIDQRAAFDIIRYASCWEDTDVLLKALNVQEGDTCLSIASAGDNALSLLVANPSLVVATDLSDAQLACLELRKAAFSELTHEEMLQFLGFRDSNPSRQTIYADIKGKLSPVAATFWDGHSALIEQGIIHTGKFERYLRFFGQRLLRLIHSRKTIRALIEEKTENERVSFYNNTWNTWRWRLLFKLFFSRYMLGRAGRDPEFLRYVEGDVASRILERSKLGLTITETHNNPYLTYILTGQYGNALPFYARPENYNRIKNNLERLISYKGTTDEAITSFNRTFDAFNLSDIFEYMGSALFEATTEKILDAATPGARIAYWNMLVPRNIADHFPQRVTSLTQRASELFKQDRAFFYQSFHLDQVTK